MQGNSGYPVRLEADYPESSSRILALLGVLLIFPKALLLLPHIIILAVLEIVNFVVVFIGYLAVLLTGRYPEGLFNFVLGVGRWNYRVDGWLYGFTDRYPPFSLGMEDDHPIRLSADYPESSSRLLALLGLVLFFPKLILLLPHLIILYFLGAVSLVVVYLAFWAILFTGQFPRGLFNFAVGMERWRVRTDAWVLGLADRYPPLSLE